MAGVPAGLADEYQRQTETEGDVGGGEQERRGSQPVGGGERAGGLIGPEPPVCGQRYTVGQWSADQGHRSLVA
jgi:hypothetical protein